MLAADRYSALVTVLAVLVTVIYAKGAYDTWDAFLGIVGFVLGVKYIPDANREGAFFVVLVASLLSASLVAMLFSLFERSPSPFLTSRLF